MNNVLQMVENKESSEFYPTPEKLVEKMLDGIEWDYVKTILEPSAGKGDILRMIAKKEGRSYHRTYEFDVDCIEIDPNLRQILKYNFSDERKKSIFKRQKEIEDSRVYDRSKGKYNDLPGEKQYEYNMLEAEAKTFFDKGIHIVHDDFLSYIPYKQYDLIIMNPPFSNGDIHLLKALDIQKKGGSIICLLNAETIRNPFTETRRELLRLLDKYGAIIEYIEDAFVSGERRTGVEVALIKVVIERVQEESEIYNRFKKAAAMEDIYEDVTDLEVTDYIKAIVNQYNVEVQAGLELIRQYRALKPYMLTSFDDSKYNGTILKLTDTNERSYNDISINDYLRKVRLKYWEALLSNKKFVGKLTSKLQNEYRERVNRMADYDFSEFNINQLTLEMNAQIKQGIEDEIIAMFDRLTEEHSWHPEMKKNKHYYDGWATNIAYKIGKKVIIPCYGLFSEWDGKPRIYEARSVLEDIERVLNFLDGDMTRGIDLWENLDIAFKRGETKNIELKFFKATFYKKGTIHLTFTCPDLIERFNIYAAQNRGWLPPSYGKKRYKDMTETEKTVINSFQGEAAYENVMQRASYFLAPVTKQNMLMLESGESE